MSKCICFLIVIIGLSIATLSGCSTYQPSSCGIPITSLSAKTPHYAAVKNGKIEYYQFGHGSPIVLIPGYATDVSSWDKRFLATLATHHQVIVLNNRDTGGSVITSSRYDIKALAEDTYQLIQALHLKKPTVLGISMGGMIAQQLAVLHPTKIGKLVLVNTAIAGKQAIHPSPEVEKQMVNMPTYKLPRLIVALKLFFPPETRVQMTYVLITKRFLPQNYKETDMTDLLPKQQALVQGWINDNRTAKKLAELKLPVLVVNGEADIAIPPENSVVLARSIPHAKLIRWHNGGHGMIFQYPVAVADMVSGFVLQ